MSGVLDGVRVVDLGRGQAASVAALLLAEAGADVVKVEPPEGHPDRGSARFAVWNRSKRSVALDVDGGDRAAFQALLGKARVLVHDLPPAEAARLGLDRDGLETRFPGVILCAVTAFPEGHADADMPLDDMLVLAASGLLDEQPAQRREGPAYLRFPLGSACAAWLAATGVVAQLLNLRRHGAAAHVSTSLLQGALLPGAMLWHDAERDQASLEAGNAKSKRPSMFECADGVWLHLMHHPDDAPMMRRFLDDLGPEKVEAANAAAGPQRKFPNYGANILAFRARPSGEWLADLWASDVPVQPAVAMGEIYEDEQSLANGYVVEVDDPVFGLTRQPGPPFTVDPPARVRSPAPRLDQDRAAVLAPGEAPPPFAPTSELPLKGLTVLDFGIFLAGPMTAMLMADLGAEVVKIESLGGDPMRPNASAFTGCQRNKRALAINLKDPRAAGVVARLVGAADVVHHNLRMPAAERLGLGYDRLRGINPRLVYSHVSSYGPAGPRKDWPGYDQLFQAQCGWEVEGGGAGNPPMWHRYGMMDHQCALASLHATLLGLLRREQTGEGGFVAASLLGASVLTVGERVRLADGTLTPVPVLDARQIGIAPGKRLYRCADGWIVVDIADALAPAEGEMAALDVAAAIERVGRAGGLAAPVREDQGKAFLRDPANRALGLVAEYAHAHYGRLRQPGQSWSFAGTAPSFRHAPPVLGEHSAAILEGVGYSPGEVAGFVDSGLIAIA